MPIPEGQCPSGEPCPALPQPAEFSSRGHETSSSRPSCPKTKLQRHFARQQSNRSLLRASPTSSYCRPWPGPMSCQDRHPGLGDGRNGSPIHALGSKTLASAASIHKGRQSSRRSDRSRPRSPSPPRSIASKHRTPVAPGLGRCCEVSSGSAACKLKLFHGSVRCTCFLEPQEGSLSGSAGSTTLAGQKACCGPNPCSRRKCNLCPHGGSTNPSCCLTSLSAKSTAQFCSRIAALACSKAASGPVARHSLALTGLWQCVLHALGLAGPSHHSHRRGVPGLGSEGLNDGSSMPLLGR